MIFDNVQNIVDSVSVQDIVANSSLTIEYRNCKANKGAAGVDGVRFEDIEASGEEEWLGELAERLKKKDYRPEAVKRVWIPKPNGKQRPLGIPTITDRVVQTAAMIVLDPIFEADLQTEQYAYRAERGAHDAVREVHRLLTTGHTFGRCYSRVTGRAYIGTRPSKKSIKRMVDSITEETDRRRTLLDAEYVVGRLNRKLTGWANYFCLGPVSPAYQAINTHVMQRLRRWLCRKHKVQGSGRTRYPLSASLRYSAQSGRNFCNFSASSLVQPPPDVIFKKYS